MGCGQAKMKPLYQDNIQLVQVIGDKDGPRQNGFMSKDQMKKDKDQNFDDAFFFNKAEYYHVDKIEIFVRDGYIMGIGITYNLDGVKMTKVNKGRKMPKTSYELELGSTEHIEFIQFRFSEEGIHELLIKTNLNRMLMMDEAEHENLECQQRDFNLADNGEVLIGFKGKFDQYITNLSFYKVTRVGFKPQKASANPNSLVESFNSQPSIMRLASIRSEYTEQDQNEFEEEGEYYYDEEDEGALSQSQHSRGIGARKNSNPGPGVIRRAKRQQNGHLIQEDL